MLVAVVAFLPWAVRLLVRSVSGFEDISHGTPVEVTRGGNGSGPSMNYVPDRNTDYLCSTPNASGTPCPEGTFCNGVTQSCERKTVGGIANIVGYFS